MCGWYEVKWKEEFEFFHLFRRALIIRNYVASGMKITAGRGFSVSLRCDGRFKFFNLLLVHQYMHVCVGATRWCFQLVWVPRFQGLWKEFGMGVGWNCGNNFLTSITKLKFGRISIETRLRRELRNRLTWHNSQPPPLLTTDIMPCFSSNTTKCHWNNIW